MQTDFRLSEDSQDSVMERKSSVTAQRKESGGEHWMTGEERQTIKKVTLFFGYSVNKVVVSLPCDVVSSARVTVARG